MALNILANGNVGLQSDQITFIHLSAFDAGGNMVPNPSGDVDTVAAGGAFASSLNFAVGVMPTGSSDAGDPAVVCTPMVLESDVTNSGGNITLTITSSAGLTQMATKNFDIVRNVAAVSVGLDTTNTAVTSQPAPAAAGP